MHDASMLRTLPLVPLLLLLAVGLILPGCGRDHPDYEGHVWVDNQTHTTTNEALMTFRLARFGDPFSGNVLAAPIEPDSLRLLGTFAEDYYDAEGDLEMGGIIEWFDEFVGYEESTTFVVL